jgi:hypothetical protein
LLFILISVGYEEESLMMSICRFFRRLPLTVILFEAHFLTVLTPGISQADVVYSGPNFTDVINQITDTGQINFKSAGTYRLWGVSGEVGDLRDTLINLEVGCYDAGVSYRNSQFVVGIIRCNMISPTDRSISDLGWFLISTGKAKEICSESNNMYGTCN